MRPYIEKVHHNKRAGAVAQGVGPEFKPQYYKKKSGQVDVVVHTYNPSTYITEAVGRPDWAT
jgi:hypothetical protein